MTDDRSFLQRVEDRKQAIGTPTPMAPPTHTRNGDSTAYTNAAHRDEIEQLSRCPNGSRNHALNVSALKLGRLPIDRDTLRGDLIGACHANGLVHDDGLRSVEKTIESAFSKADADGPRGIPERPAQVIDLTPPQHREPTPPLEELEQDFWTSRDELQLIYRAALSRMASPWAVLGCCTARILALVPAAIRLPAIIGGPGSLNWFAAIVAKSGGGKGAAMSVASQLAPATDLDFHVRGIGSGEGMIEAYRRAKEDELDWVESVLFSIDEIDSLGAMGGRSGQTTMAIVRQGFSGEKLGYSYRGRQSEIVPAHTYRMTVVASVQPERAGTLFDDAGGGTPQRFMWFPGRDKRITATPPAWPDKQLTLISRRDLDPGVIEVPQIVETTIREARAASMNGDDNALDGHALFCREKFAYALAYLNGRGEINDDDWRLSGIAARVSDWCRTKAQEGYDAGKHRQSRDRGALRAIENDERSLVERAVYEADIAGICKNLLKHLDENGPTAPGALRKTLKSNRRPRFEDAVKALSDNGKIELRDGKWVIA